MINPYSGINWQTINRTTLTTHDHCKTQYALDRLLGGGVGAVAISNYYKSEPAYPIADKASSISDPSDPIVDWSGVTIEIPNAEHHNCNNVTSSFHFNSVGSTYSSGKASGETPVGVNDTWQTAFNGIKSGLLYSSGGGITINHPVWSKLTLRDIKAFLDYDPCVLGLEIYNQTCELMHQENPSANESGWALEMWDAILKTGRRCWGFAVPDHDCEQNSRSDRVGDPWLGRIVVLTSSVSQQAILEAIRNGAFYAELANNDVPSPLKFVGFTVNDHSITVNLNKNANIKAVVDGVTFAQTTGASLGITVPSNAVYARFEATADGDTIYSNPVMYRGKTGSTATNLILMG